VNRWLLLLAALGIACPAPAPPVQAPPHVVTRPPPPPPPDAAAADAAPPEAALPKLRLPRTFLPTSYDARLEIEPGKPTFAGEVTITGEIHEAASVIWLHGRHLAIKSTTATGPSTTTLTVTPRGEDLLEIRAEPALEPGTWRMTFEYTGEIDRLNTVGMFEEVTGGTPYVFSQLEATYARRVFPCLDEPDSKVPWHLVLDIPAKLAAVSNTPVAQETALDAGRKRIEFARTRPLPSYLVAFAVGPFDFVDAGKTKSGVPVRMVVPKGRAAEAAFAAKTTPRLIDALEEWFGTPFPYEKLDALVMPLTVGFVAMENASLATFAESVLLVDPAHASQERKHRWVVIAAHELAHQWFGDLVTTAWWDDVWLNEAFATWLQTKIASKIDPASHEELSALDQRIAALEADRLVNARRVRQPIESADDVSNVFDGITYYKGCAVLAMFEHYLGADVFQRGVREYVKARAYANATSTEFVAAIGAAAGKDLAAAFSSFLDQPGEPELEATLTCSGGPPRVELSQSRYVPPGSPAPAANDRPWIVPVCVAYERGGKRAEACTLLDQTHGTLALETKTCPRWLMPNVGGYGYYRSRLTTPQITALRDEAWPMLSWTERRELFFEIGDEMHLARVPLQLALSFVPRMLAGGDRFTTSDAVTLPLGLEPFVPDELRGKYEAAMRALFAPGATRLGPLPKDSDDLDAETVRARLFGAAAWHGRDPELVKQAVDLAGHWRDLPASIRRRVITIAADASPELYDRLLHEVKSEPDRTKRSEILAALSAVRDPDRLKTALALTLDPGLDYRESEALLRGTNTEATRATADAFFRAHADELVARMPKDEVNGNAASLATLFTGACDARHRDDAADYVTKHFAPLPGGERVVKQAIEAMDQCIASRAALDPEIRAWLQGFRLPRPDDKKKPKK
jgi:alanyl aminopeptidase